MPNASINTDPSAPVTADENLVAAEYISTSQSSAGSGTGKTTLVPDFSEVDCAKHPTGELALAGATDHVKVSVPAAWEATEKDWTVLRHSRNLRAWKLCALALDLNPVRDIVARLKAANQVSKLEDYETLRAVVKNNIVADDSRGGLKFVLESENDGRRANPTKGNHERVVDVFEFVKFATSRQFSVSKVMMEFADQHSRLVNLPTQQPPSSPVQVESSARPQQRDELVIGLLICYIRDLALSKKAPPMRLLKGPKKSINASTLGEELLAFTEARGDQLSEGASKQTGLKITVLRHALGGAAKRFPESIVVGESEPE